MTDGPWTPECTYACRRGCDHEPFPSGTVHIDRDRTSYADFLRDRRTRETREHLRRFLRAQGLSGTRLDAEFRGSSGGHVHLRVTVYAPLTREQRLLLRAHLGDDWKRIVLDMKRLAVGNPQVDRAWDQRYTAGKMSRSTPWKRWFTLN